MADINQMISDRIKVILGEHLVMITTLQIQIEQLRAELDESKATHGQQIRNINRISES
jgi:hypothetical protein